MITLHYYPGNASFAPHVCLTKIGVPFTLDLVDRKAEAQRSPGYTALNPNQRIPTLICPGDEGSDLVLWEAAAICLHLADLYPSAALMPAPGSSARGRAYKLLMFLTNTLQPEILTYHYADRHVTDPAAVPAVRAKAEERIGRWLAVLADELGDRPFLVGDDPTLVDYYFLMNARWTRKLAKKAGDYGQAGPYLDRVLAVSEVRRTLDAEGLDPDRFLG